VARCSAAAGDLPRARSSATCARTFNEHNCHSPISNVQPFVDLSAEPSGKTSQVFRGSWETAEFEMLLRNAPAGEPARGHRGLSVGRDHQALGKADASEGDGLRGLG
jgi:hypothetical protein